jgi:hypothetical protein
MHVLLLRRAGAAGNLLLRLLQDRQVESPMRFRRALLLAGGLAILPAVAAGQT